MTTAPTPGRTGASRAPGFVFAVLACALLVLVATALNPAQPPPPAVAEYAPEAVQALKEAPKEQASDSGIGEEGEGGSEGTEGEGEEGTGTTTTTAPPPIIEETRVKRCVGDPPRQTEDPQSPPCAPYWDPSADNGGATSMGVTSNEIRIAVPNGSDNYPEVLERYLNSRFQFWGRELQFVRDVGCFGGSPASAKNTADRVAKLNVFASISFCDAGGAEYYYYDQLARNRVVSVNGRPIPRTEAQLAQFHPYEWTYLPTYDKGTRHLAELACTMKDKLAAHAGPPYTTFPRKFGVFTNTYDDAPPPDNTAMFAALAGCGIELGDGQKHEVTYERGAGSTQQVSQNTLQQIKTALLQMQNEDVTTILIVTHALITRQIYQNLDAQGYQPELGVSTYFYNDEDFSMSGLPRTQTPHTFAISTYNKFNRLTDEFFYRIVYETDPAHSWCCPPFGYFGARYDYNPFLMLASGIQLAGPNLTPETFAAGLQKAKFPNPDHPNMPGKVTVGPGTHSFMEDAAAIWWDPSGRNPEYGSDGNFCYVDNGRRRRLGQWPSYPGDRTGLFERPCQRW